MAECSLLCRQGSAAAGDGGVRSPARRSPRASSRVTYDRTGSAAPALVHERSGNGAVRAGQAVLRAEAAAVHPRTCIPTRCQVGGHCCAWANPQPPCCTALPPVAAGACESTAGVGNDGRYHRTAARFGLPRCVPRATLNGAMPAACLHGRPGGRAEHAPARRSRPCQPQDEVPGIWAFVPAMLAIEPAAIGFPLLHRQQGEARTAPLAGLVGHHTQQLTANSLPTRLV